MTVISEYFRSVHLLTINQLSNIKLILHKFLFKDARQAFNVVLFMAALRSRCGHYIFALWFLLRLSFLA